MQILIRHGRLLDPESDTDRVTDILIEDGKVTRIGDDLTFPAPYRREVVMAVGGGGDVVPQMTRWRSMRPDAGSCRGWSIFTSICGIRA